MSAREKVLRVLDLLPDEKLPEAERLLRHLLEDPVLLALANAPADDEPYTEEEQREDEEAIAAYHRGEFVTHEEIERRVRQPRRRAA